MKDGKCAQENFCPGCRRHCPACALRCKYGRAYFEKRKHQEHTEAKKRKWEKYVHRGGLAWRMFFVCRSAKKALRDHRVTEEEMFAALTDAEKKSLSEILEKIRFGEE